MTKRRRLDLALKVAMGLGIVLAPAMASATPSTTYWAPSVATCQGYLVPHITYDTYYGKAAGAGYPVDTGLTMGVVPGSKFQAEIGYDALLPTENPVGFYLNGKGCVTEGTLFKGAPSISAGIYNIGFHGGDSEVPNNYSTFYITGQKTLGFGGYISLGYYHGLGTDALYTNSDGDVKKDGALIGWASPDIKVGLKGLQKILVIADVQTGKNAFGGGGFGVDIYFNDYIGLIVGPVWYYDKNLQPGGAQHLWTTQLDVDIPLGKAK